MPRRRSRWRIALLELALSPSTRSGVVRGQPLVGRGTRIPSRTWPNAVASLTLPGVSTMEGACPGRRRRGGFWWSARFGTGRGPGAPARGRDLPVRPCLCPLFTGSGRALVGPVDRGVDREVPSHPAYRVVVDLDVFQQLRPGPVRLPGGRTARRRSATARAARADHAGGPGSAAATALR